MNINFNKLIKDIFIILFIVLITKLISLFIYMELKDYNDNNHIKSNFENIKFTNYKLIKEKEIKKETHKEKKESTKIKLYDLEEIKGFILKGLYVSNKNSLAIIEFKKETKVLGIGEYIKNYKLIKINENYVVLIKNNKKYIINFYDKVDNNINVKNNININDKRRNNSLNNMNDYSNDGTKQVSLDLIHKYKRNAGKIFKEIKISDYKFNDKNRAGFKVDEIKPNTIFTKLGLRKGDVILKVNNLRMNNYKNALKIYRKIDNIQRLEMVVLRNGSEIELEYEIY